jgi:hypothetical protein
MPTRTGYITTNTFEGVLEAGVTTVFTGYSNGATNVVRVTLTNPNVSVTVKLNINRVSGNSVQVYSYTLAAGDVMVDTFGYNLTFNDTISIDNSDDGTVCVVNATYVKTPGV